MWKDTHILNVKLKNADMILHMQYEPTCNYATYMHFLKLKENTTKCQQWTVGHLITSDFKFIFSSSCLVYQIFTENTSTLTLEKTKSYLRTMPPTSGNEPLFVLWLYLFSLIWLVFQSRQPFAWYLFVHVFASLSEALKHYVPYSL